MAMNEEKTNMTQFDVFKSLNAPVNAAVYVTPDGTLGAQTFDGRVMAYGKALTDITEIAVRVREVEIHTQKEPMATGRLFIFNDLMHQCVKDDGAIIKAFRFHDKAMVDIVPETLSQMGDVRAIGVVDLPEAAAFGGDMFLAAKMIAAGSADRDALQDLRRKERMAAQMTGTAPKRDNLDEMMVFAANPGALAFQTLMQQERQTAVLTSLAVSLSKLVGIVSAPATVQTAAKEAAPAPGHAPDGSPAVASSEGNETDGK